MAWGIFNRTPVKSSGGSFCQSPGAARGMVYLNAQYKSILIQDNYAYVGGRTQTTPYYPIIHKWHLPSMTFTAEYIGEDEGFEYGRLFSIADGDLWGWRWDDDNEDGRIDKITMSDMTAAVVDLLTDTVDMPTVAGDYLQCLGYNYSGLEDSYRFDNDAEDMGDVTTIPNYPRGGTPVVARYAINSPFYLTVYATAQAAVSETENIWQMLYLYEKPAVGGYTNVAYAHSIEISDDTRRC